MTPPRTAGARSSTAAPAPGTPRRSGPPRPGAERLLRRDDRAGDLDELEVLVAGHLLQPPERTRLVQGGALHQDALGALDQLAVLQRLPQVGRLPVQRLQLGEA